MSTPNRTRQLLADATAVYFLLVLASVAAICLLLVFFAGLFLLGRGCRPCRWGLSRGFWSRLRAISRHLLGWLRRRFPPWLHRCLLAWRCARRLHHRGCPLHWLRVHLFNRRLWLRPPLEGWPLHWLRMHLLSRRFRLRPFESRPFHWRSVSNFLNRWQRRMWHRLMSRLGTCRFTLEHAFNPWCQMRFWHHARGWLALFLTHSLG